MNTFEVLSIIGSALLIFGAIVSVYVSTRVSIAKIEVKIVSIEKDLFAKEFAICRIEKDNKEDSKENRNDHKEIISKIDRLVETLIK